MIQFRRLAAFLVGVWLAGSLFMDATAISNFRSVDRLMAAPGIPTAELIHDLGREKTRILLRRGAGESNIYLFEQWEWLQLGLGLALLLVLLFGQRPSKVLLLVCLAMLGIVMASRFVFTPEIARLGRLVEFLPSDPSLSQRKTFGLYHGISSSLELLKLGLGLIAAALLLVRRRTSMQGFVRDEEMKQYLATPRRTR